MKTVTLPGKTINLGIKMVPTPKAKTVAQVQKTLQWEDATAPESWGTTSGTAAWDGSQWVFSYESTLTLVPSDQSVYALAIRYGGSGWIKTTINSTSLSYLRYSVTIWTIGVAVPSLNLRKLYLLCDSPGATETITSIQRLVLK